MWLTVVPREVWGAVSPRKSQVLILPATNVFCLSTFTEGCLSDRECEEACYNIQTHYIAEKGYDDLRYNFLIGGSGQIYEGRGWFSSPVLPSEYAAHNRHSLLLGFIGFHNEDNLPYKMRFARDSIVEYGLINKYIAENFKTFALITKPY